MNNKRVKCYLTVVFRPPKWLKALLGPGVTVIFTPAKRFEMNFKANKIL